MRGSSNRGKKGGKEMGKCLEGAIRIFAVSFLAGLAFIGVSWAQQGRVKLVQHIMVVDSKGKAVGVSLGGLGLHVTEVLGGSNELRPIVVLQVDQHLAAVNIARDRFFGGPALEFDSENCTGSAFLPPESSSEAPPLLSPSAIGPPGQSLYLQAPNSQPQAVTIRSIVINSHLIKGGQCVNVNLHGMRVPAQPLVDLLTVYTPPFSLRAAP